MSYQTDEGPSSGSFHSEDDVRAYVPERVSKVISKQYPDLNAMDPHLRAPIVDDCIEHVVEVILDKMDRAEDFDALPLSAGLIRKFLAQRNFEPSLSTGRQQKPGAGAKRSRPEKPLGSPTPFVWQKPKRREWLHANHYIRKYVTATVAPGGVGKSSNAIVEALAMVTGRGLPQALFGFGNKPPLRVWYVNGEDPLDEVNLRFAAAMQHFGVEPEDVAGRLFVDTGREKDFVFARDNGKSVALAEPLVDSVVAGIKENGIDVLILDPFVAFHLLPESDNTKVNQVVRQFAEIAEETNASVELVAHTRKIKNGNEVETEDARGAKALTDAARSVRTANPMTEQEGEKAGLGPGEFLSIFRLDKGKPNMVKRVSGSTWRLMASVMVECEDGYEDVGVCDAWSWPCPEDVAEAKERAGGAKAQREAMEAEDDEEALTPELIDEILGAVCRARGRRADMRSPDWMGYAVMPAIGLKVTDMKDKRQMNRWLALLVKSEDLMEYVEQGSRRHPALFLDISDKTRKRMDDEKAEATHTNEVA